MRTGAWLIVSLIVAALNGIIVFHSWWCIVPALALSGLFWRHFYGYRFWGLIVICCCSILFGWQQIQNAKQQQSIAIGQYSGLIQTHPDWYQISDGYLTGRAISKQGKILFAGRVDDQTAHELHKQKNLVRIDVAGNLELIEGPRNRYSQDWRLYWASNGVFHKIKVNTFDVTQEQPYVTFSAFIYWLVRDWHFGLVQWFEKLPAGLRDYGQTLFLGYTRNNFYVENMGIKTLGLVHLFSISGFQVTGLFSLWRQLSRAIRLPREDSLIIGQVLIFGLWLFAGDVQALLRAVLAGILNAWRGLGWIRIKAKDIWGITLIIGLLYQPLMLSQLGCQLSYLLTFGMLWLEDERLTKQSIGLGLLIAPLMIWYTYTWHPITLLANVIIIPFFTYAVLPVVAVGVLAYWGHLDLIGTLADRWIELVRIGLSKAGAVPGEIVFGKPPLLLIILLIISILVWIGGHKKRWLFCYIGGLILAFGVVHLLPVGILTFFDVGQGDAALVRKPYSETVMFDVGGNVKFGWLPKHNYDVDQMVNYLHALGISKIDHLVLSHKDVDHVGNLADLQERINIKNVYIPQGMPRPQVKRMTEVHEMLASPQSFGQLVHPFQAGKGENEDSISMLFQLGARRLLLTGDLDQAGEQMILQHYPTLRVDFLKFGHHGSRTSSGREFVQKIKPQVGIVSAGVNNRYQHPHHEVLKIANDNQMQIWSTPKHGMIEYKWFGKFEWWRGMLNGPHD